MNAKMKKMKDRPYYRAQISHRCAIRTLESIQNILNPKTGTCSWRAWDYNDNWDNSIYSMVNKIEMLKQDSKKYHELKNVLNKVLK
jgi:hypothetical protein